MNGKGIVAQGNATINASSLDNTSGVVQTVGTLTANLDSDLINKSGAISATTANLNATNSIQNQLGLITGDTVNLQTASLINDGDNGLAATATGAAATESISNAVQLGQTVQSAIEDNATTLLALHPELAKKQQKPINIQLAPAMAFQDGVTSIENAKYPSLSLWGITETDPAFSKSPVQLTGNILIAVITPVGGFSGGTTFGLNLDPSNPTVYVQGQFNYGVGTGLFAGVGASLGRSRGAAPTTGVSTSNSYGELDAGWGIFGGSASAAADQPGQAPNSRGLSVNPPSARLGAGGGVGGFYGAQNTVTGVMPLPKLIVNP